MNYSVIIAAAGNGGRMGLKYNKVFYQLTPGHTILEKTVDLFLTDQRCKQIVVVTNPNDIMELLKFNDRSKIVFAMGGKTRQESVYNGLMAVTEDIVLVHDGARPWCPMENIDNLLEAMLTEDASVLAVSVTETVKVIENGYIKQTIPRDVLVNAQTPQAFKTKLLMDCHNMAITENFYSTDDAQLVERFSNTPIKVVEGSYGNIKITTINDVEHVL